VTACNAARCDTQLYVISEATPGMHTASMQGVDAGKQVRYEKRISPSLSN